MTEPTDFEDARWRNLVDFDATGDELSVSEREFVDRYRSRSREVQAEQALREALQRLADGGDVDEADDPVVDEVVRRYLGETSARPMPAATPEVQGRRWWPRVAATVFGIAAAGLAAVWLWPESTPPTDATIARAPDETQLPEDAPRHEAAEPEQPTRVAAPRILLASGRLEDEAAQPVELEPVTSTGVVRAAATDTCVRFGSDTACFDKGTQLQLHQRGDEAWVEVIEGTARVRSEIDEALPTEDVPAVATTFEIRVAGTRYASIDSAVWTVEVRASTATVDVTEGKIRVEPEDASPTTLGASRDTTDTAASARIPDADTLLQRARQHRADGERAAAIRDYEALVRHHPKAPAVLPSLVTLGELHLDAHQPKKALRWFDRYLAQGGALEEEALYGRIRALRALGRDEDEARAIQRFLERFPSSSSASKLRRSP